MAYDVLSRPAPAPDFTVRYGDHPEQIADVRLPHDEQVGPLLIFIHGGFWRSAYDRSHVGPLSADLAGRGFPVATIEYRRVGQVTGGWPGTFDDVAAAVGAVPDLIAAELATRGGAGRGPAGQPGAGRGWAGQPGAGRGWAGQPGAGQGPATPHRRPSAIRLDTPILAGHSAGGQLALWCAGRFPAAVAGVVALAPVADLVLAHRLGLSHGAVTELLGGGPDEVPDRYAAADPGRRLPVGVRTVVLHGTEDDLVPPMISRAYVAAAQKAGDDVRLVELPGVEHFGLIDPHSTAWPSVLAALGTFGGQQACQPFD